jgi:predicted lipid-binding transport protein (Tim44 family)
MEQEILERFAQSTMNVLIFGILIGSLFSIAILAIFDAIKAMRANCSTKCATHCDTEMKKPAPKAVAKPAAKKAPAKAVAKPTAKKPVAKKAAPKKKK